MPAEQPPAADAHAGAGSREKVRPPGSGPSEEARPVGDLRFGPPISRVAAKAAHNDRPDLLHRQCGLTIKQLHAHVQLQ